MIGGNVYIFKKTQCLQLLLQGTKSTLLPYINDIMLFPEAKFIVLSISTPLESIANIIDLIGIFARPHPYFWTIHKKPWPSKGYASKLKVSPYREIFFALDEKMTFYEHLKEIGLEKMLFRKFTYASKLKISPYREIFFALDEKMTFYEHLKEIGLEKMLFRKFTYPFRVRSVF